MSMRNRARDSRIWVPPERVDRISLVIYHVNLPALPLTSQSPGGDRVMPDTVATRWSRRAAWLLAILCCGAVSFAVLRPASAADKGPIRIGFLTVKTGALAAGGRQMEEGLAFYLDQHKGMLAGRKIEVTTLDTAGQPGPPKARAEGAVRAFQVAGNIQPARAFRALAINDYVKQAK